MLRRCASAARVALFTLAALARAATMWSGCGSDTPSNPSSGDPVDAALFVALPPPCAQALQLCTEEFIYPYNGESSVEFMGNFRPNGWVDGVYFSPDYTVWQVFVEVPSGQAVSYKYLVNGTTWVNDPGNANVDGQGNSLKAAITCPYDYTCAEDAGPAEASEEDAAVGGDGGRDGD